MVKLTEVDIVQEADDIIVFIVSQNIRVVVLHP
jgi:hypothetical protein